MLARCLLRHAVKFLAFLTTCTIKSAFPGEAYAYGCPENVARNDFLGVFWESSNMQASLNCANYFSSQHTCSVWSQNFSKY